MAAEEGSISRAAVRLNISQPAVSRQIPHALHEPATLLGLNPLLSTCWGVPVGQLAPAGYRFSKGDGFLGTESESA